VIDAPREFDRILACPATKIDYPIVGSQRQSR